MTELFSALHSSGMMVGAAGAEQRLGRELACIRFEKIEKINRNSFNFVVFTQIRKYFIKLHFRQVFLNGIIYFKLPQQCKVRKFN